MHEHARRERTPSVSVCSHVRAARHFDPAADALFGLVEEEVARREQPCNSQQPAAAAEIVWQIPPQSS